MAGFHQELQTTTDVIDELGGNHVVAALTNSNAKAVSMWKTFGKFPWRTQLIITEELRKRKKSAPASLWGMSTKESVPQ